MTQEKQWVLIISSFDKEGQLIAGETRGVPANEETLERLGLALEKHLRTQIWDGVEESLAGEEEICKVLRRELPQYIDKAHTLRIRVRSVESMLPIDW